MTVVRSSPASTTVLLSPRRLAANRSNALLSTGPRSLEGKARSSQNSLMHGLLSGAVLIRGEDPDEFAVFRAGFQADLVPVGATEEFLADQVVASAWRLRRLLQVDAGAFEALLRGGTRGSILETVADVGPKLARYAASIERSFYRALSALKQLQANRPWPVTVVSESTADNEGGD